MRTFSKLFSAIALSIVSMSGFAQTNAGQECGCPAVASRPTVNMSTLLGANNELTAAVTTLDCGTLWIMDTKVYVPSGKVLAIQAGTVVKASVGTLAAAPALIVERGGKIFASGKEECPIVFTTVEDNLDGTYGIENRGKWGGVALCGYAKNTAVTGYGTYVSPGVAFLEGFYATADLALGQADTRIHYGGNDDDDNSGILQYVSIRHSGATLIDGNEINALTLASVGRKTQIDHVEFISCDDDNIEFFGGTVNIKYVAALFGNDDAFDTDHGWSGKAQFLFGLKATDPIAACDDNGLEMDGSDKKAGETFWSRPFISNATFIGNNSRVSGCDNTGPDAIQNKDRNEGTYVNCIFANYRNAMRFGDGIITYPGAYGVTSTSYDKWRNGAGLTPVNIVKNNTFLAVDTKIAISGTLPDTTGTVAQFLADGNIVKASIGGFSYPFVINGTTNVITTNVDVVPTSTDPAFPLTDPFFTQVSYRGAFQPGAKPWISKFAEAQLIKYSKGVISCTTDINGDGKTDGSDFTPFQGQFGKDCQ